MTKWVYKEETYYPTRALGLIEWLDKQGEEGWELVQTINSKFEEDQSIKCIFKRKIED